MKHTREDITHANTVYHNAIADQYDERLEGSHPAVVRRYQEIFDRYVLSRVPQGARVLDFGCGTGWLEALLPASGFNITGIDISEGMLRRARARFPNVEFVQGDLYTHPFTGTYDLVMEKAVLHHLLDWEALVDRMADLTKPGGVMFLGNEPSSFAYKALAPLKYLFRKTINRNRTDAAEELLGDAQYEALS
jgi:2-polyprenyl-3-methyl-5-hydroxy-6-metoxy-1,4-benzoquinol methylase